ncbi:MAG TPA: DUF1476 domain-containing protein [Caulobacteraceae bacterium]|jgi:hypothetical protein
MSSLDDREKGFERKFVADQELEFRAASRRNRMLGEWAGRLMGLESVDDYAKAVLRSHLDQPGDEDVLRKVSEDLAASGLAVRAGEVRSKMDEFMAVARGELRGEAAV